MSSSVVRTAVWARVNDNWTATRIVDLENRRDPLGSSLDPWVSVQFLLATEEQICLGEVGDRGWREDGSFQLLVGVPTYTGWASCLTHLDNLRALFRSWVPSAGFTIRKVHPPQRYLGESDSVIGNWFIAAALVSYQRDFYE